MKGAGSFFGVYLTTYEDEGERKEKALVRF